MNTQESLTGRERDAAFLRERAAENIIIDRRTDLKKNFGTPSRAGRYPSLWRPYHVTENRLWTDALKKVFAAAFESKNDPKVETSTRSMLADLQQDDLPAMLIAASCFYPDFTDFYHPDPSLALWHMKRSGGVFRERDYDIVEACIQAATVKKKPEDKIAAKQIEPTKYAAQQKVFFDTLMGCNNSLAQTPHMVALLGLERLIEKREIHTKDGTLPGTLEEVMSPSTTFDREILRDHINVQKENFFGDDSTDIIYVPQLDMSKDVLTHLANNKRVFRDIFLTQLDEPSINIADLLRKTYPFPWGESSEAVRDEWVASLS